MNVPQTVADAINGMSDAAFLVDDAGVIQFVNDSATRIFLHPEQELVGMQVDELMPDTARDYHRSVREQAVVDRQERSFTSGSTFECQRKSGELFQGDISLTPTTIDGQSYTWVIVRDLDAPTSENTARQQAFHALDIVGMLAASTFDLARDISVVHEQLQAILPFHRLSIVVKDEQDPEMLEILYSSGGLGTDRTPGERIVYEGSAAQQVMESGGRVSFTRREYDSAPKNVKIGLDSGYFEYCVTPLEDHRKVFGVLLVSTTHDTGFTSFQRQLIERLGVHLSVAVLNQRMRDQIENQASENNILAQIGRMVGSTLDLQAISPDLGNWMRKLVPANSIIVTSITEDYQYLRILYMDYVGVEPEPGLVPSEGVDTLYPIAGRTSERVLETHKPMVVNAESGTEFSNQFPGAGAAHAASNLRSVINLPLVANEEVFGFLTFRTASDTYGQREVEAADHIAQQLASSVAFTELRRRDGLLAHERATLVSIGHTMGSAVDISNAFNNFADQFNELIPFDACMIVGHNLSNGEATVLQCEYRGNAPGIADIVVKPGDTYRLAGTLTEQIAKAGEPVIADQLVPNDLSNRFPGIAEQGLPLPFLSMLGVPLTWGGEVVAALWVGSHEPDSYDQNSAEIAERVAAQIAGPIAGQITRQREAELENERRRRAEAELEATALAELNETKSNFVSALSHELKTPLTSILAFADILNRNRDETLPERAGQHVRVIQRNARHLEGMINELLDLSRMETGRFEILKAPFDFVTLVRDSIESSQVVFDGLSQSITDHIDDEVLLVNGDRDRLLQVVNNLLNNASKYSPAETDIELSVENLGDSLKLSVSDRGPGLPEENVEGLFEMFHRADNEETRRIPGTGIGLHVSKRIIDEHGGIIELKEREGGGATASFTIPIDL